jgi:hypothetical protein
MLIDSQGCRNIAIVLVLFVERVRVSLDLSFVEKLAKTQDFFCTPPVLGSVACIAAVYICVVAAGSSRGLVLPHAAAASAGLDA